MRLALTISTMIVASSTWANNHLPNRVVLAATDWCPFTCPASQNGRVETTLKRHFAKIGVQLEITYLPWVRALKLAEVAEVDGVVTLANGESDILIHGQQPIQTYQDCFYTRPESTWKYLSKDSLVNVNLGSVAGYSYDDSIDLYIEQYPTQGAQITGSKTVPRLMGMLESGHLDAIIAERSIASLWLPTYQVKETTCLQEQPLYIGLNPGQTWASSLLDALDQQISR